MAVIHMADGSTLPVRSPLFKPTWNTATAWARYGFHGAAEATPRPVPVVQASAPAEDKQIIGRIEALSPTGYDIEEGVPARCAHNERPARHLHFTPLLDPGTHPLTDILIEDETQRVCSMRFRVATSAAVSVTGYVRVDFGERGGYWIATGGGGDYTLRFFGFGMKHASMSFGVLDPTFV